MTVNVEPKTETEGKRYKYYGQEYRLPVEAMAAAAKVSVRFQKDVPQTSWAGVSGRNRSGIHDGRVFCPRWHQAHTQGSSEGG